MIGACACSGSQALIHIRESLGDEATDDELIEQIHNFHVLSRWKEEQGICLSVYCLLNCKWLI